MENAPPMSIRARLLFVLSTLLPSLALTQTLDPSAHALTAPVG